MRICSCTYRACSEFGPCDVQKAVDATNQRRAGKGLPPLSNTSKGISSAVGMFYAEHKAETGHSPCRGCEPLVRKEVEGILAGIPCQGGV